MLLAGVSQPNISFIWTRKTGPELSDVSPWTPQGFKAYSMLSRHQNSKLAGATQPVAAFSVGTQASGPAGRRRGSWTAASK